MTDNIKLSEEYKIISEVYGLEKAKRSGVPLINHINEGLIILDELNAPYLAKQSFCLHPIYQTESFENKLTKTLLLIANEKVDKTAIIYAYEYRLIANSYLSNTRITMPEIKKIVESAPDIIISMLIADKVQNRKDFEIYHKDTHDNSIGLDIYFRNWLHLLNVSEEQYTQLSNKILFNK